MAAFVNGTEAGDGSEVDAVVFEEKVSETTTSLQKKRKAKANAALLTASIKLSKFDKIEDLFDDILEVNAAIDALDNKSERGSHSPSRKSRTLIERWTSYTIQALALESTPIQIVKGEDCIGQDTMVTCNFKSVRRKDSPTISKDYWVLGVYDKFYNKSFMTLEN